MTPQEQGLLAALFDRLKQAEGNPRGSEADRYIADAVRQQPAAPYFMAQLLLVQDQALSAAQGRVSVSWNRISRRPGRSRRCRSRRRRRAYPVAASSAMRRQRPPAPGGRSAPRHDHPAPCRQLRRQPLRLGHRRRKAAQVAFCAAPCRLRRESLAEPCFRGAELTVPSGQPLGRWRLSRQRRTLGGRRDHHQRIWQRHG